MIEVDAKQLEGVKAALAHLLGAAEKAVARAVNRAAQSAKVAAIRKATQEYVIKRARISETFEVGRATPSQPSAFIRSKGRPRALPYFRTRPRQVPRKKPRKALFAQVKQGGGGTIRGAFLARMKSGHLGVFHRTDGSSSLPIQQNYGPSVPQMLRSPSVSAFIREKAQAVLGERLEHEVGALLKGVMK